MSREVTKSIPPGSLSVDEPGRTSLSPPETPTSWAEVIASLQAAVKDEALSTEERAWCESLLTVAEAHKLGMTYSPDTVLAEWTRCAGAVLSALVAGKLIGYGPLRFHFACDLATEVARRAATQSSDVSAATGARVATRTTLTESRVLRREARRVLKNLAGRDPERRAQLRRTSEAREKVNTRSKSLADLAAELKRVFKTVPARIAREAGATPEFVRALNAAAKQVVSSDQTRQRQNQKVQQTYGALHVLKGRLVHELRAMLASARDARRGDPTVAAPHSPLATKSIPKKKPVSEKPVVVEPVVVKTDAKAPETPTTHEPV